MNQQRTLVARAIVRYELAEVARRDSGSGPLERITTDRICEKYGLAWGRYHSTDLRPAPRAHQMVRNELSLAFHAGLVGKLRKGDKKVREGRCVVYVDLPLSAKWRSDAEGCSVETGEGFLL